MKIWLLAVFSLVAAIFAMARGCLVDPSVALEAVDKAGYSDAKVVEHAYFAVGLRGCSESDAARFTVKAVNPAGREVTVTVCSGWLLKNATIRF